ncbi:cation diffusion facilitator family transporter [Derxia gummosa]|uniref:Cation diffusion facilitator family transporter n=1 Tax=Derxia gummosa DSM 723 TaxID=1121388 RepID=A0A8B6X9N2_9BURK|nr:cation diffusion facilitator family transporter [Derxia gummosa]
MHAELPTHAHLPDDDHVRRVAQRSTLVSVAVNVVLATVQVLIGVLAHSAALVSDGVHSLSDLASDFVVLLANHHSRREADEDHPYGHLRFENAASLALALLLAAVGAGMLWAGVHRLFGPPPDPAHVPGGAAVAVAVVALVAKEGLFRYMLAAARGVKSSMLEANAWHARSDAASSLVVALGVAGSMAGWGFLDPLAAAIVGLMICKMAWEFGFGAIADLTDRAASAEEVAAIRETLQATPGARDLHRLRTRKMGDRVIVDAHLLVDPLISVSEGHYIAESARHRLLKAHGVVDATIHIDPEDDVIDGAVVKLPGRETLLAELRDCLGDLPVDLEKTQLHYLEGKIWADVFLKGMDEGNAEVIAGKVEMAKGRVLESANFVAIKVLQVRA